MLSLSVRVFFTSLPMKILNFVTMCTTTGRSLVAWRAPTPLKLTHTPSLVKAFRTAKDFYIRGIHVHVGEVRGARGNLVQPPLIPPTGGGRVETGATMRGAGKGYKLFPNIAHSLVALQTLYTQCGPS